jgi:hypothetical protein
MAKYVRREIRQRGFFGWMFLLLFYGFNALMLVWLLSYWGQLSSTTVTSDAARVGKAIGGTIGSGFIVSFWGFGAVILGLFALLTRGSKTIVEDYGDRQFTADDAELRRNIAASRREPTF